MIFAGLEKDNLKHKVMKRFAISLFAAALMICSCGSSESFISGDQEFILETQIPNDPNNQSFHKAIATELEDGFKVVSDWGGGEFDSLMIRIEFSIDHFTFTIKSGHVYLKSITDDQIVVRFKNACFTLIADRDYLLNGDLSFTISQ